MTTGTTGSGVARTKRAPWAAPPLWVGLIFGVVGPITMALGVGLWLQEAALADRGVAVEAVIDDTSIDTSDDGTTYRIHYRFESSDGGTHGGSTQVDWIRFAATRIGEPITVSYLPDDPSVNRVGTPDQVRSFVPILVGGVGGLFGLIGIGISIDGLRRRRSGEAAHVAGPKESAPGIHRFHRSVMRILVDLVLAPIGALAFLAFGYLLLSGTLTSDPLGRALGLLAGFFGVLMATGALTTVRRGVGRTVFEIGPDGAWSPEMGRLRWDEIAEVRLESMRGPGGGRGHALTTNRYLRLGIVPKDPSIAARNRALGFAAAMTKGFMAFAKRLGPQVRLGPTDLAPFGVVDYEIEESIDDVVEAARRYAPVIDADERRARERAPMWSARAAVGAATPPIVEAEVRAIDAGLDPGAEREPTSIADVTRAAGPPPSATFARPPLRFLNVIIDFWRSILFLIIPLIFAAVTVNMIETGGGPIWFEGIFLVVSGFLLFFGARSLRAAVARVRRSSGPPVTLSVGPDGIWIPEMERRMNWEELGEVRTVRAGIVSSGPGSTELWRLVVVPAGEQPSSRSFSVDSDLLDAPFDDVLDLIRYYHPVVETG